MNKRAANARECAFDVLRAVFADRAFSNLKLKSALDTLPDSRRALCKRIVFGVIQNHMALDYNIARFCKIKWDKISPDILCILRMAAYQIYYMDAIPDSAAVNESVELAKKHDNRGAAGFVNALLRAMLRDKTGLTLPSESDIETRLSVEYSLPRWMVEHFLSQYGRDNGEGIISSVNAQTPVYIRLNEAGRDVSGVVEALDKQGARLIPVTQLPGAFALEYKGDVASLDAFRAGLFFVQDISSQRCVAALDIRPGDIAVDVCAAPGGKSMGIAQSLSVRPLPRSESAAGLSGKVYAFDIYEKRAALIERAAARLGLSDLMQIRTRDARELDSPLEGKADRVLADVPCSGLGTIARKPDVRFKSKDELDALPKLQLDILRGASRYVKSGGILVYSTCTLNRGENECVVDEFLRESPGFEACDIPTQCGQEQSTTPYVTLMPHACGGDGFFFAKLRRK